MGNSFKRVYKLPHFFSYRLTRRNNTIGMKLEEPLKKTVGSYGKKVLFIS